MPSTSTMQGMLWLSIAAFFCGLIYTMIVIGQTTASGDTSQDMKSAIGQIAIVNCVLVAVLGGTAYFYTNQVATSRDAYIMFVLHVSLLLSLTSISVSTLFKKT